MTQDWWVKAALTDKTLVANLLFGMKHSDSKRRVYTKAIPSCWGNRKNRSKSSAATTHRGSPTTHLSWSGGSGSDESHPSDLSSGFRSVKGYEFASTSSYNNKSHKRKSFFEIKEEEGSLIKQRMHINKESTSMRVNLNQQMSTSQNMKKIKINYGQTARNKTTSCRVEAELEPQERGFVVPDLNMTPNDDDLLMTMS